jgi:uncharacterized protein (DUF427 family)
METKTKIKTSKGKEVRIPGPDHPITISRVVGKVRVTVAGTIVAESAQALRLEEKGYLPVYYLPRNDAHMSLLVRTKHYPYQGDCTYCFAGGTDTFCRKATRLCPRQSLGLTQLRPVSVLPTRKRSYA